MRAIAAITAALLVTALSGGGGQAAPGMEPKELPPAGYGGNQYVDSDGCVFLRAGLAGQTTWVPRFNRDRQPVCGYEPTFPAGLVDAAAAVAAAPVQEPPAEAKPEPAAAALPAVPQPVAAQAVTAPVAPKPTVTVAAQPSVKPASKKLQSAKTAAAPTSVALIRRTSIAQSATYCADRIAAAQRYLLSDGRRVTQCAAATELPAVGYLNGLGIPGLAVSDRAPSAAEVRRAEAANQGAYRVTHVKGRLNAAGQAAMAAPAGQSEGSATSVGAPYVQVGAFAQTANAERAIATLKGLGLPVSVGVGGRLRVILAGPFASSAEVSNALALVRRNGYRDAFPTRG